MGNTANPDMLYQQAVDNEAKRLLGYSSDEITSFPDYGSFLAYIAGHEQKGGFWHHKFSSGTQHIYFQLNRKLVFGFYKNYLVGIKMNQDGSVALLTDEEVADYD